jgi:hypothetical protein
VFNSCIVNPSIPYKEYIQNFDGEDGYLEDQTGDQKIHDIKMVHSQVDFEDVNLIKLA